MRIFETWQWQFSTNAQLESEIIISQVLPLNEETPRLCQELKLKTDSPWEQAGAPLLQPKGLPWLTLRCWN